MLPFGSVPESVVKATEETIKKKWSKTLVDATRAHEVKHEVDTEKWKKAPDDATKVNELYRRQEEYKKWQKAKVDATTRGKQDTQKIWRHGKRL